METKEIKSEKATKTLADLSQFNCSNQISVNILKAKTKQPEGVFVEPFYGGSHKQLIDTLQKYVPNSHLVSLKAKKWPWRARCSALIIASMIPSITTERFLFCSSVLSLAELLGLRPDLHPLKKIVYFHENQLVYPIREIKERDIQFAYNQITTCLAADVIVFNSYYNKQSFLDNIKHIMKMLPDYRPQGLRAKIEAKSEVIYFLLELSLCHSAEQEAPFYQSTLRIVWPHRWEFDKNPETFVNILLQLQADGLKFQVAILGEAFEKVPEVLSNAKDMLKDKIVSYGFLEDKEDYYKLLQTCHIAVSTAQHEFFGVSMVEACLCGCFPLVPDRLVYPEIYPKSCLYSNDVQLYVKLKEYALNTHLAKQHWNLIRDNFLGFCRDNMYSAEKYIALFK